MALVVTLFFFFTPANISKWRFIFSFCIGTYLKVLAAKKLLCPSLLPRKQDTSLNMLYHTTGCWVNCHNVILLCTHIDLMRIYFIGILNTKCIFYYYFNIPGNIQKVFQKAFLLLTQFTPFNINVVTWPDLTWKCDNPSSMYIYICKYAHSQKYSLHRGSANCKWHKTSLGVLLTKQGLCETIPDQQL